MTASGTVDVRSLLDASGGNRETAASLARLYFELTADEITRLDAAITAGDASTASAIAHKCAGSSIACGMSVLAAQLKKLELESARGMPANAAEQLADIRGELAAVQTAMENHFNCSFAS